MKRAIILGLWSGVLAFRFNCVAVTEARANPYSVISQLNAFKLKPVPVVPPPPAPEPPSIPPLEIKLTGIVPLPDARGVVLEFFDPQTKKTERPPVFREGDAYRGEIRIVMIDPANGLVRISNRGLETTLDFEKNGVKPTPMVNALPAPPSPRVSSSPPPPDGKRLVFVGNPSHQPDAPRPTSSAMTREEAEAFMEQQRAMLRQQNDSRASILPPPRPNRPASLGLGQ